MKKMILSFCVTHKNTNVPLRESLSFKDTKQALAALIAIDFVEECVLLQTCNRVEIHLVTSKVPIHKAINEVVKFWSQTTKVSKDTLLKVVELFEGRDALHHLLLLASGLESMVIGEDQILGQIRNAYLEAKETGVTKSVFDTIFNKAVNVGRKIRVKTKINKGSVSVSSIAVDLAEKSLDDPKSARALVIGAGKTGELASKELSKRKIGSVFVANRTYQRSVELTKEMGGRPISFEEIYDYIPKVNLVIAAVSVPEPILTNEKVKEVLKSRTNQSKLLLIDLSQPRCIEEKVGHLSNVNLKTIDDLRDTVNENLQKRLDNAIRAREIVIKELNHLETMLHKMAAEPIITNLCRKMEDIRRVEFSKAIHMLNGINEDQSIVIENLTKQLVEKILQIPIEKLRNSTLNGEKELLLAASSLFSLKVKERVGTTHE
jgi:glutamyl-tRNA reductase